MDSAAPGRRGFPTTRWSVLIGARSVDEGERRRSWEALVAVYWRPVYHHLRRRWRAAPEDAQDLAQAFLARAFEKDFFAEFDPARARFRTFVRVCLDRFAANEAEASRRQKRGGGEAPLSLDFGSVEAELDVAVAVESPEAAFDREWRRSLFRIAVEELRARCDAEGHAVRFRAFERYDLGEGERPSYAEVAADLGIPVTTVTNHLARARRELRRVVLERLGELCAGEAEYRAEARELFGPR